MSEQSFRLLSKVRENSVEGVNRALQKGANVNFIHWNGDFALSIAATDDKYYTIAKLLLKNGAHVNLVNRRGKSSLTVACENGSIEIAILLLENDADVDALDSRDRTPLMNLCTDRQMPKSTFLELAKLLLSYGANINKKNQSGMSALMVACESNNCVAADFLIQEGAQVNYKDFRELSALIIAYMSGSVEVVSLLLATRLCEDVDLQAALMMLCTCKRISSSASVKLAELLLKHGADVNDIKGERGRSTLMVECEEGNDVAAESLIDQPGLLDLRDNKRQTALMIAIMHHRTQAAEMLIDAKADLDLQDNEGNSALMLACISESEKLVVLLITSGANMNLQNNEGQTALMQTHHTKLTTILLEKGARLDLKDINGKTALVRECQSYAWESEERIHLLLKFGQLQQSHVNIQDNEGVSALMIACEMPNWLEIIDKLLNRGANVNLKDNRGQTALMRACEWNKIEYVRLLLNNKAQVNIQDNWGQSALMIACSHGWQKITKLLLESGAKISVRDVKGMNALDYTEKSPKASCQVALLKKYFLLEAITNDDKGAIDILLNDGVEIDSRISDGRTALILACENRNTEMVKSLIERGACIDLQDNAGNSALQAACQNRCAEIVSCLLDNGADTLLKNNEGLSAHDIAIKMKDSKVLLTFTKLRTTCKYPGILFTDGVKKEKITPKGKIIDLKEVGISLSIPQDALSSTEPPLELEVRPCFSGPFEAPQGVELVSPAYIVKPSRKVSFKKKVLVKIWHHAHLESKEDCEDMVFLSASTTPKYRGDSPVYVFREIRGAKGLFRPGEEQPVGEIALRHFCTIRLGKRKRNETSRLKGHLYSVRLYKAIKMKIFICICLFHPQYMKNCRMMMEAKYSIIPPEEYFDRIQVVSDEVFVTIQPRNGKWKTAFKKDPASIQKAEICAHEDYNISDLLEMDYPPKIEIAVQSVPDSPDAGPLCLHVEGLDRKCIFNVYPDDILNSDSSKTVAMVTSNVKQVEKPCLKFADGLLDRLKKIIHTVLTIANEMLTSIGSVEDFLQMLSSHTIMIHKLDQMKDQSQQLKKEISQIPEFVNIQHDLKANVEKANTLAIQIRTVYGANRTHRPCSSPCLELFVDGVKDMIKAIKEIIRMAQNVNDSYCQLPGITPNQLSPPSPIYWSPYSAHQCSPQPPYSTSYQQRNSRCEVPEAISLTRDHTAAVCRCLYPLRAKWKTIGTFLCVDHDSLEAIQASNEQLDDRLMALIAVWLRRHTPPPTWQALADAVQNIDPDKAQEIMSQ